MFRQKQTDTSIYWYNPNLLSENVEQAFSIGFWKEKDAITGSAQGRGTTWFVQGERCEMALRHYRRGGVFGKFIKHSYWFSGYKNSRAYKELEVLKTLVEAGVNVPTPIAAKVIKKGLVYQSDILVTRLKGAKDLVAILGEEPVPEEQFFKVGQEIRKMHNANVNHTDLNIHNILIDENGKIWLIDFDKCGVEPDGNWKQSNLNRLKRSFEKERKLNTITLPSYAWSSLVSGYQHRLKS